MVYQRSMKVQVHRQRGNLKVLRFVLVTLRVGVRDADTSKKYCYFSFLFHIQLRQQYEVVITFERDYLHVISLCASFVMSIILDLGPNLNSSNL